MTDEHQSIEPISNELIESVRSRLADGQRVRRTLPGGGRLFIDRPLPFLCVYRAPSIHDDVGTHDLLLGEASFLFASGGTAQHKSLAKLVETVVAEMAGRFDAFLLLEIWSAPDSDVLQAETESALEPTELRPAFAIRANGPHTPMRTLHQLHHQLERIRYLGQAAHVDVDTVTPGHPSQMTPLLSPRRCGRYRCQTMGLAVRPIYRDPQNGELFPAVLRMLRRGMNRALKHAFFTFAQTRTTATPRHFYSLGSRAMVKAVWDVDRRLATISDSFDFVFQVTPVNAEAAWSEFKSSKFERIPRYYYRPLAVEPTTLKRSLYSVPIENIEDPSLAHLFRQRQDELDRQITMLSDVGSRRFILGSMQVYGTVDASLLKTATDLLKRTSPHARDSTGEGQIDAQAFAEHARAEIAAYRRQYDGFAAEAIIREDMYSGLLCSGGNLLIGQQTMIPTKRIRALLQHEIGTHLLTYYNGLAAPFQQLHTGFAGYDALQEGLAVLTEHLVGGLSQARLRLLAARVISAHHMVEGATFVDMYRLLTRQYAFTQRVAYTVTMRTFRGGGLTKDMVYLRGLLEIIDYLRHGGDLDPLFYGKIASDHIALIRELRSREVLKTPPLRPLYLEDAQTIERLNRLHNGSTIFDLVEGSTK